MNKIMGIAAGALVCSLAATAFAGEDTKVLGRIAVTDDNKAYLWPATGTSWDGNECTSRAVVVIDTSTEAGRLMYQTALAAYLAGQEDKAYWSGSGAGACIGSYPRVTRIEAHN